MPKWNSLHFIIPSYFYISCSLAWLHSLLAYKFLIDLYIFIKKELIKRGEARRREARQLQATNQQGMLDICMATLCLLYG